MGYVRTVEFSETLTTRAQLREVIAEPSEFVTNKEFVELDEEGKPMTPVAAAAPAAAAATVAEDIWQELEAELEGLEPEEAADAVLLVHHEIAHLEVPEIREEAPQAPPPAPGVQVHLLGEDVAVGEDVPLWGAAQGGGHQVQAELAGQVEGRAPIGIAVLGLGAMGEEEAHGLDLAALHRLVER